MLVEENYLVWISPEKKNFQVFSTLVSENNTLCKNYKETFDFSYTSETADHLGQIVTTASVTFPDLTLYYIARLVYAPLLFEIISLISSMILDTHPQYDKSFSLVFSVELELEILISLPLTFVFLWLPLLCAAFSLLI